MKPGRGRPRKIDPNRKQISVEQAIELSKEYWAKFGRTGYARGTIYNMVSSGKLHGEHKGKGVLLFEDEVRQKLCG